MLKEFKEFAVKGNDHAIITDVASVKGNVVDLAVGVIIGGAFGKIVTSLVNDIVMPPIGLLLGGVDFSELAITLKEASGETAAIILNYGLFINAVIDFTIIAFAIFIVIKQINKLKRQELASVPTEKECPYCTTKVPIKAKKCAHCTADISIA